ncbi:MAG: TPM domain-containing protein, partial [Defluviitaleaceae bacterium]|nr:TPM domain-containing protein [Defluviitaleaceae bacterium]
NATVQHIGQNNDQMYFDTGSEIFVYVMNFVPMGQEIEDYTLQVFNNWRLGRPDTNNGVLITMAVEEGLAWMVVGEGLQRYMPSSVINNLFETYFVDDFFASNYDAAVISLFDGVMNEVYRHFPPSMHRYQGGAVVTPIMGTVNTAPPPQNDGVGIGTILFIVIAVLIVASLMGGGGRRRRMGRMGRRRGMGGMMGGFMLGRMSRGGGWGGSAPRGGSPGTGMGSGYRPPSVGGGIGGSPPRRPGAGGFGGYGGGRGGYSRGGGGGISRGGMGGGRRR